MESPRILRALRFEGLYLFLAARDCLNMLEPSTVIWAGRSGRLRMGSVMVCTKTSVQYLSPEPFPWIMKG